MDKLGALAGGSENHLVLADHVAAAQDGEADIALAAWADIAIADADAVVLQRNATACRGGFAEQERGAGGCVALVAVVQLKDLDVELRPKGTRHSRGEPGEQIDTKAHIAGLDDGGVPSGGFDLELVVGAEPRCAN